MKSYKLTLSKTYTNSLSILSYTDQAAFSEQEFEEIKKRVKSILASLKSLNSVFKVYKKYNIKRKVFFYAGVKKISIG